MSTVMISVPEKLTMSSNPVVFDEMSKLREMIDNDTAAGAGITASAHGKIYHHHQFNVHFLPRLIKGMDGCFPTSQQHIWYTSKLQRHSGFFVNPLRTTVIQKLLAIIGIVRLCPSCSFATALDSDIIQTTGTGGILSR